MSRPLTDDEAKKVKEIDAISDKYIAELQAHGAMGHAIGIHMDIAPDLQCLSRLGGSSGSLLNLLCALAWSLMPEDFQRLLVELHRNPEFAHLREVPNSQKTTLVN